MRVPRDWVKKLIAQACPPAAKLLVVFEGLGGYDWRVEPFSPDATSRTITEAVYQAVNDTLASLAPVEAVTLLDRLYTSSPVRFELRREQAAADSCELAADSSELLARFLRSRSRPGLLLIQANTLSMNLTLRASLLACPGTTECPVCGEASRIAREVYPGADGCSGCGAIFVGRRR